MSASGIGIFIRVVESFSVQPETTAALNADLDRVALSSIRIAAEDSTLYGSNEAATRCAERAIRRLSPPSASKRSGLRLGVKRRVFACVLRLSRVSITLNGRHGGSRCRFGFRAYRPIRTRGLRQPAPLLGKHALRASNSKDQTSGADGTRGNASELSVATLPARNSNRSSRQKRGRDSID